MLSRALLRPTRPSTLSSSLLARSYAAPLPSYTPRPTPPPPPPPPASSAFPTAEYTSPPSATKQPPAWAAALARVSGIKLDDVKARAEALQSARNPDGTIAKPTAAELREGMSNAKGSIAKNWMSSYQEEKARKSAKPKADGTWEELSFMEKLVPDKEGDLALRIKHEQKEFGDVLSPRVSLFLQAIVITGIWLVGVFYPPDFATLISPRASPAGPSAESKEGKEMVLEVEKKLQQLAVVREYRKLPGWYECRPYTTLPDYAAAHSLTAGTLRGPSKLAVPPLVFAKDDESEALILVHLGRSLCGHDGIVHGGMVATILDEATGRNALLNLPTKIGVTANLNINYRAPTKADQFVVIKTKLTERKGRKAVVEAEMWTLTGERLADASAIYVEPKWAALLTGSGVEELLGKRPETAIAVDIEGVGKGVRASGITAK